jgi:hypothetical protein
MVATQLSNPLPVRLPVYFAHSDEHGRVGQVRRVTFPPTCERL